MNKRIRYAKRDNAFVSVRNVNTDHGQMKIKYFEDSLLATIIKANEPDTVIDSFTSTTLHELKKTIKSKLISMGAVFADEKRVLS